MTAPSVVVDDTIVLRMLINALAGITSVEPDMSHTALNESVQLSNGASATARLASMTLGGNRTANVRYSTEQPVVFIIMVTTSQEQSSTLAAASACSAVRQIYEARTFTLADHRINIHAVTTELAGRTAGDDVEQHATVTCVGVVHRNVGATRQDAVED